MSTVVTPNSSVHAETPASIPPSSSAPIVAPPFSTVGYDIAQGAPPVCRSRDAVAPLRPFAVQTVGDLDGDGHPDRVVIGLRNISGSDVRRDLFVAYGSGMTAGPLRGMYGPDAPSGVTDVEGAVDLDGDGRAELLVALNGNQPIVGIARVRDCDVVTLTAADGSVFVAATEVNGHNCCPDQFASFRCVQSPGGVDIITTQSFPTNSDGTYVRPEDLIARGSSDPADLDYKWSRTHWKVNGDIVRVVATETGAGRGRDIATDLLSAGLDCLGVTSLVR